MPNASEKLMTLVIRLVIVGVASIAIFLASYLPPILAAMIWLFAWLVPVFFVLSVGVLWRPKSNCFDPDTPFRVGCQWRMVVHRVTHGFGFWI